MEFQSTTCSSTFTPVCFVYCSDRPCQNGRVWSLLYSAMTTLMDRGLPPEPSPHALRPSSATTLNSARARRPRLVIAAHTAARARGSQQAASGTPSPGVGPHLGLHAASTHAAGTGRAGKLWTDVDTTAGRAGRSDGKVPGQAPPRRRPDAQIGRGAAACAGSEGDVSLTTPVARPRRPSWLSCRPSTSPGVVAGSSSKNPGCVPE